MTKNGFTIPNLDQATVNGLLEQLKSERGTTVQAQGNEFYITGQGVTAQASFDPGSGILHVMVTQKPWIVPVSMIESKLRQAIDEVRK